MHCKKKPGTHPNNGESKRSVDKPGIRCRRRWCGGAGRGLALLIAGLLALSWGCSGGEDKPPEGKNKVVVAIKKPMSKPAPEKKVELPPATPRKPAEPAVVPEKAISRGEGSTEQQEPLEPKAAAPEKPGPVPQPAKARPLEKPGASNLEKGFVNVREGESLSAVAAREDVYGDPLKWPRLYRLNSRHLSMLRTWEDVKKKPLPEGLSLRYVKSADERGNQSPFQVKPWVITIRSWQTPGRLAVPAMKLIRNGYDAYITRAVVKGKSWLRLRVGFYRGKSEALAATKKIRKILGNNDSWISRAGKREIEEFGSE